MKSRAESQKRKSENRRDEKSKSEKVRSKEIQVLEKAGKSQNTLVSQCFVVLVARRTFPSQNVGT